MLSMRLSTVGIYTGLYKVYLKVIYINDNSDFEVSNSVLLLDLNLSWFKKDYAFKVVYEL